MMGHRSIQAASRLVRVDRRDSSDFAIAASS